MQIIHLYPTVEDYDRAIREIEELRLRLSSERGILSEVQHALNGQCHGKHFRPIRKEGPIHDCEGALTLVISSLYRELEELKKRRDNRALFLETVKENPGAYIICDGKRENGMGGDDHDRWMLADRCRKHLASFFR